MLKSCNPQIAIMKTIHFAVLAAILLVSTTPVSHAQDVGHGRVAAGAEKDLLQEILGYWVIDFDSAATKAMLASGAGGKPGAKPSPEELGNMKKEMGGVTFEIKEGLMVDHEGGVSSSTKLNIKSQDPATRTLVFDATPDGEDKSIELKMVVDGGRITMSGRKDGGHVIKLGLKRIDKESFEKRVAEQPAKKDPLPDRVGEPQKSKDGHPIAEPVPDKAGFVFSPHSNKVVDVRDLPSGTLVMDPTFPAAEKKYFRVP